MLLVLIPGQVAAALDESPPPWAPPDRTSVLIDSGLTEEVQEKLRTDWGIEVVGLRLTAGGHMLDFRYRLLDASKGKDLFGWEVKPVLTDLATGLKLEVPRPPKIGPLKQTRNAPIEGRTYFVLFGNPGRFIKTGSVLSLEIGKLEIEQLVAR